MGIAKMANGQLFVFLLNRQNISCAACISVSIGWMIPGISVSLQICLNAIGSFFFFQSNNMIKLCYDIKTAMSIHEGLRCRSHCCFIIFLSFYSRSTKSLRSLVILLNCGYRSYLSNFTLLWLSELMTNFNLVFQICCDSLDI